MSIPLRPARILALTLAPWLLTPSPGAAEGDAPPEDAQPLPFFARVDAPMEALRFGSSVSAGDVDGDGHADLLVGAPDSNTPGYCCQTGDAWLYLGPFSGEVGRDAVQARFVGSERTRFFGATVSLEGDFNGDGHADPLIAIRAATGAGVSPAVVIQLGPVSGELLDTDADIQMYKDGDSITTDRMVVAVAPPDAAAGASRLYLGYPELRAGAEGEDQGRRGAVMRLDLTGPGLLTLPDASQALYTGGPASDVDGTAGLGTGFGAAVAAGQDLDGDGYMDLVVGMPAFDAPFGEQGGIALYYGADGESGTIPFAQADAVYWGKDTSYEFNIFHGLLANGDRAGQRVQTTPDVTGDRRPDILVYADHASDHPGAWYALSVGARAQNGSLHHRAEGRILGMRLPESDYGCGRGEPGALAVADVNGDGVGDLILGQPVFYLPTSDCSDSLAWGAVRVFLGPLKGDRPVTRADATYTLPIAGSGLGETLLNVGDLYGDGIDDLAIGAPGGASAPGAVYLVSGASLAQISR